MGDGFDNVLSPVPQTREAFDWLRQSGSPDIEDSLTRVGREVREVAPDCVAVSLAVGNGELTFTLASDRRAGALLDAMQYVDGGPCLEAVAEKSTQWSSELPTDEGRWQLFARGEATLGISSTLSMPVARDSTVIGGVNLYGATPDAFDGRHEEIASICGAWAEGAITNADLGFSSRVRAAVTPQRLQERGRFDVAVGIVAEHRDVEVDAAEHLIRSAARRAGVSTSEFAVFLIESHHTYLDASRVDRD